MLNYSSELGKLSEESGSRSILFDEERKTIFHSEPAINNDKEDDPK